MVTDEPYLIMTLPTPYGSDLKKRAYVQTLQRLAANVKTLKNTRFTSIGYIDMLSANQSAVNIYPRRRIISCSMFSRRIHHVIREVNHNEN